MITTIETRLKLDILQEDIIDSCINLWSWGYRKTWVLWNNKHLSEKEIYYYLKNLNYFTVEQIGSLITKVKSEHSRLKELTKYQIKKRQDKLENINKFVSQEKIIIAKKYKKLTKLKMDLVNFKQNQFKIKEIYSSINQILNSINKKEFTINNKNILILKLNKSIKILKKRIELDSFKLCFGSSDLLSKRVGNYSNKLISQDNQKKYSNLEDWKFDWDLARNNIWISSGKKIKPQGNPEIQYDNKLNKLRVRVTEKTYISRLKILSQENGIKFEDLQNKTIIKYGVYRMKARFIEIDNVEFIQKNQRKINDALNNKQPITAKIIKRLVKDNDIGYYLQLSFDEPTISMVKLNKNSKTIGIDLNQKGLAYCIISPDGNKLKNGTGFIKWNLIEKSTEQRNNIISNGITKILNIAQKNGTYSIAIENLDFNSVISNMNSGYDSNQKYNKMLTNLCQSKFQDLIIRKSKRLGMTINVVNPAYSSIGGFSKYGLINKLPVDISASLWLARQSIYGEEFKRSDNVIYKKKHIELVSLPYMNKLKQSKRFNNIEKKWADIGSELGRNRVFWYKNIIKFIQTNSVSEFQLQNLFEDLN